MAAYKTIDMDLATMNAQVKAATGQTYPIAITEYSLLASFAQIFYTTSFASAIYAADILSYFNSRTDILMANYWSLVGDSIFGTYWNWMPNPRPVYFVFLELSTIIKSFSGTPLSVPFNISSTYTVNTPNIGFTSAATIIPFSGMVISSSSDDFAYLFLINKDLNNSATVTIPVNDFNYLSLYQNVTVTTKEMYTDNPMTKWSDYDQPGPAASINWTMPISEIRPDLTSMTITMRPHSIQSIKLAFGLKSNQGKL